MRSPGKAAIIEDGLFSRITTGVYKLKEALPSESSLCREFEASRGTVRKALEKLQQRGLIYPEAGKGYFLNPENELLNPAKTENRDTILFCSIDFKNFNTEASHCLLYSQLEELLASKGGRLIHIENSKKSSLYDFLREIEETGAKRIIIDYPMIFDQKMRYAFLHHLNRMGLRGIVLSMGGTNYYSDLIFSQVFTDWRMGGYLATKYLAGQGHKKILFAGIKEMSWSQQRRDGFLAAMEEFNLWNFNEPLPILEHSEPMLASNPARYHHYAILKKLAAKLLEYLNNHQVDAIVSVSDTLIEYLRELVPWNRIPPVVGFDNATFARDNGISSVALNARRYCDEIQNCLESPMQPPRLIGVAPLLFPRTRIH
jgi:DNA-binding LacI/PurR family transcriptional regulator/biotin operon repressor